MDYKYIFKTVLLFNLLDCVNFIALIVKFIWFNRVV